MLGAKGGSLYPLTSAGVVQPRNVDAVYVFHECEVGLCYRMEREQKSI
jgi:hypothetical protein